jgi:Holliday junction DNA helicase RuvA
LITRITGRLLAVGTDVITLEVGSFEYEVLIPEYNRRQLQGQVGQEVRLFTIEYLEGNAMQGYLTPRLIGFVSEAEREFFELFCSVDGIGTKKALRAMVRPVREVAAGIEDQDAKALSGLPGIGPATAERIIAKLRRKVPKFALMVARDEPADRDAGHDLVREAYDALRAVGHSESDARRLVEEQLAGKKKFKDVQELLGAIWQGLHRK